MTTTVATPTRSPGQQARTSSGTARGAAPLLAWCGFGLVVGGKIYRSLLLTLVAIAMVPNLWDWTSYVVRTGSMEPSISVGDVVIGQPFGATEKVPVGRVMIFDTPAGSGTVSTLRVHRVVAKAENGAFTTAGDANASNDPSPVPRENFRSRAVIRVPYVGLPLVWLAGRNFASLALWLAATALLLHLSFRPTDGSPPRTSSRPRSLRRLGRRVRPRWLRARRQHRGMSVGMRTVLALVVAMVALAVPSTATAAFTDTTATAPNTWKAAEILLQPYTAAVRAESPYAFYRLDEASGSDATDASGNTRTGTYASVATYQQAGALPTNPGYAIGLAANSGRMVGGGTGLTDPTTFSAELWFKTTTAAGGKLIGFENSRNATSTSFDREAFMRTDGKVVYMGATSTSKLLVSPTALNNGAWHHLVITAVPSGSNEISAMYVDGALVASGNTMKASLSYIGWWRVGFGRVPTGTGYPLTGNFTGSVDDVAIYTTQLSAARVAAHYAAR
jgi:signal peptidase I